MVGITLESYGKEKWKNITELIEQRRSMGELDHPESQVVN